jgi:hypothetical protein
MLWRCKLDSSDSGYSAVVGSCEYGGKLLVHKKEDHFLTSWATNKFLEDSTPWS